MVEVRQNVLKEVSHTEVCMCYKSDTSTLLRLRSVRCKLFLDPSKSVVHKGGTTRAHKTATKKHTTKMSSSLEHNTEEIQNFLASLEDYNPTVGCRHKNTNSI